MRIFGCMCVSPYLSYRPIFFLHVRLSLLNQSKRCEWLISKCRWGSSDAGVYLLLFHLDQSTFPTFPTFASSQMGAGYARTLVGNAWMHVCSLSALLLHVIHFCSLWSHHSAQMRSMLQHWLNTLECMSVLYLLFFCASLIFIHSDRIILHRCGGCLTFRCLYMLIPRMHTDLSSPQPHHPRYSAWCGVSGFLTKSNDAVYLMERDLFWIPILNSPIATSLSLSRSSSKKRPPYTQTEIRKTNL